MPSDHWVVIVALHVVSKPSHTIGNVLDVTVGTATLHAGLKSSNSSFYFGNLRHQHCTTAGKNVADVSSLMVKRDPLPLLADNG